MPKNQHACLPLFTPLMIDLCKHSTSYMYVFSCDASIKFVIFMVWHPPWKLHKCLDLENFPCIYCYRVTDYYFCPIAAFLDYIRLHSNAWSCVVQAYTGALCAYCSGLNCILYVVAMDTTFYFCTCPAPKYEGGVVESKVVGLYNKGPSDCIFPPFSH